MKIKVKLNLEKKRNSPEGRTGNVSSFLTQYCELKNNFPSSVVSLKRPSLLLLLDSESDTATHSGPDSLSP